MRLSHLVNDEPTLAQRIAAHGPRQPSSRPCPACGGGEVVALAARTRDRDDVGVVACPLCGLGRLEPLPSSMADYYAAAYRTEHSPREDIGAIRARPLKTEDTWRRLRELQGLLEPGARVLDVGCGSGAFLHLARECAAFATTGTEPHEGFRRSLRQDGFDVRQDLASCGDGSYDAVLLFHVLEHLEDPVGFLRSLTACLAPEGKVIIEVPSLQDALLWVYANPAFWAHYWQFAHLWYFSPDSLQQVIERAGFVVTRSQLVQRYGLRNHLQWLNRGAPGSGDQFVELVSEEMDQAYRHTVIQAGVSDTVWMECERGRG